MLNPNHKHQNYQFLVIKQTLISLIGYVVNVCFGSNHSSSIKTTPIFGTIKIQKHAYPVKQSELSDYFLKPFFVSPPLFMGRLFKVITLFLPFRFRTVRLMACFLRMISVKDCFASAYFVERSLGSKSIKQQQLQNLD